MLAARILTALVLIGSSSLAGLSGPDGTAEDGSTATPPWPARILVTNDDGIEDESRLVALASAFRATGAEVVVAVPRENRSGTSHFMTLVTRESRIRVERIGRHETTDGGPTEAFYVVDGYPADCVVFALAGPMRDRPPDLVVSGINGGANLAEAWLGSGTIGAARIAAYAGIPALAISGIDEDDPGAVGPLAAWVARLAASDAVRELPPRSYLTVALPPRPLDRLAGVRIARRSPLRLFPILTALDDGDGAEGAETWEISGAIAGEIVPGSDAMLYDEGYVVITPMRADEHDQTLLDTLSPADLPPLSADEP